MHPRGDLIQTFLACKHGLVLRLFPFGIALGHSLLHFAVLHHLRRDEEAACAGIHRPNMRVEQVIGINRLTPDLGIKIQATRGEATGFQHFKHGECHLGTIHGELVRVPAQQIIAAVDVERTKHTQCRGKGNLMLKTVARQNGVVLLKIELHIIFKPIGFEQAIDRGRVVIILMLCRFLGLGLNENRSLEPNLVLVIDNQRQEASRLFQFLSDIGVDAAFHSLRARPTLHSFHHPIPW